MYSMPLTSKPSTMTSSSTESIGSAGHVGENLVHSQSILPAVGFLSQTGNKTDNQADNQGDNQTDNIKQINRQSKRKTKRQTKRTDKSETTNTGSAVSGGGLENGGLLGTNEQGSQEAGHCRQD